MKRYCILSLFLLLVQTGIAQISWGDYSQSYPKGTTDNDKVVGVIVAIRMENNSFWVTHDNETLQEELAADTAFLKGRVNDIVAINSFDSSLAHFFVHGINKRNAANWEYRVTNGKDGIAGEWKDIGSFSDDTLQLSSGLPQMAYLGGYKAALGSMIVIDVRRKGRQQIVSTAVVAWQAVKPVLGDIYTSNELNDFITRLSRPWKYKRAIKKWQERYKKSELDPVSGLPKKLSLKSTENNLIFYLESDIYKRNQIEYELLKEGTILRQWGPNEFDNSFIWLNNLAPGDYVLKIRYNAQRDNETEYPFLIKTAWYQSVLFKVVIVVLIIAFIGFVVLVIILVKQRQKALVEQSKKASLQLEIKAIHAQFNPHFVFNALNSIQGLINKEDIAGANRYLSVFGQLMRNSLANSDKNLINLSEEINILETYLKLEQLRFGFNYNIEVGSEINVYETEMPSLLLQPLIENAIKHGISALRENGSIELLFARNGNDMLVSLADNGKGFSPEENSKGYGLKLTVERIKLMNQVLKGQSIQLEIRASVGAPTKVYLVFTNWFL